MMCTIATFTMGLLTETSGTSWSLEVTFGTKQPKYLEEATATNGLLPKLT